MADVRTDLAGLADWADKADGHPPEEVGVGQDARRALSIMDDMERVLERCTVTLGRIDTEGLRASERGMIRRQRDEIAGVLTKLKRIEH